MSKPQANALPHYIDSAAQSIIRRVQPRTMTRHPKLFPLILSVRHIVAAGIPGDFVECGVWRGGSSQAALLTLLEQGVNDRDMHLFDTFEGMSPPTEHDVRYDGAKAADLLATHDRNHPIWARATLEDVREGMAEIAYPADRIHYHVGMVEETIPNEAPEVISLLRLDTDWYESTKHELEHLYDRLVPGGVLIMDDYGHHLGAQKATDEFFAERGLSILLLPAGHGRIAVKPA